MDPARPASNEFSPPPKSRPASVPSLIAWLSIGMIIAAWGPTFEPSLREIWVYVGLAGLVSAVGLDTVRRVHARSKRRRQQTSILRRVQRELSRPASDPDSDGATPPAEPTPASTSPEPVETTPRG